MTKSILTISMKNSIVIGENLNIPDEGELLLIIGTGDTYIKHQMKGLDEYQAVIKALQLLNADINPI
jgi:hypothetical protein